MYQAAKQRYQHVELIGFGFNHLSRDVWRPLRHASLVSLPEPQDTKALITQCNQAASAIEADVVIACKARLPSLLLGYCIKQRTGAQLIVDIDDYEPAFVTADPEYKSISELSSLELLQQAAERLSEPPYSAFWTLYAQACISAADNITTCNTALQDLYGGEVIPHLRDLDAFANLSAPAPAELAAITEPVVMFLGTPHRHKGVVEIAKACQTLGNVRPVFVGQIKDRGITNDITRSCDKAVLIGDVEFSAVPACLARADVTVMLQDGSPATRYQLPAKACDALAAGVQIVTSDTEPMLMLARMGFLGIQFISSPAELHGAIDRAIKNPLSKTDKLHNATLARHQLSYQSGAKTMASLSAFKRGTNHLIQALLGLSQIREKSPVKPRIILLLWKQNDFGVFGRRCDMVAKYLASRKDVAHVVVIEKPLSVLDLRKYEEHQNPHFKLLHEQILRKRAGAFNSKKMTVCSPVMEAGLSLDQQRQFIVNYCQEQVQKALVQHPGAEIDAWVYPYYRNSLEIIDSLPVKNVVADVVDDHRQWPGLSEEQKAVFHDYYQMLLARADCSLYNCNRTMTSIGAFSKNQKYLIPNGMDISLVHNRDEQVQELRESLLAPGNWLYVVGYAGNLESKIDWELVLRVADKNKDALLLMIGSTHMAKKLPRRRNIKYIGPVTYEKLKLYLQTFDVAIIPHLTTSLTETMNPLKAYVYGTLGIPIISTHCPNIPDLPQIKVAARHGGFTKRVRTALEEDHNLSVEEIYAITMQHSWSTRLKSVVDRIHR